MRDAAPSPHRSDSCGAEVSSDAFMRYREHFPLACRSHWFNNGVVSLTPQPVATRLEELFREIYVDGPPHVVYPKVEFPRREQTLTRLASFIGTVRSNVSHVRGVSEGLNTVLGGISWLPGDEVIITSDEAPSVLLPTLYLRDSLGLVITKLTVHESDEKMAEELKAKISQRTRLVVMSHVTTNSGHLIPVQELCNVAREHDVLTFVDCAHSAGVVPVNVEDIGCDFAGFVSYKWMYGPYGAGMLYVRPDALDRITLRFAGSRSQQVLDEENDSYVLAHDARRFGYGPWAWPILHAWAYALDYLTEIGLDRIREKTRALYRNLSDGLQSIDGVRLRSPSDANHAGALLTFDVPWCTGRAASTYLANRSVLIKSVAPMPHALRASLAFFLDQSDVDALVDGLAAMAVGAL